MLGVRNADTFVPNMQKSVKIPIGGKPLSSKLQQELASVLNDSTKSFVWPNQVAEIRAVKGAKERHTVEWKTLFFKRRALPYTLAQPDDRTWVLRPASPRWPVLRFDLCTTDEEDYLIVSFTSDARPSMGRLIDRILARSFMKRLQSNLAVWLQIERLKPLPESIELSRGFYFFCTCRRSQNWPFCDGSHKGSAFEPIARRVPVEGETLRFCRCMASESWPVCDNTHLKTNK